MHYVPGFVTDPWGTGTKKEPVDYDNMAVGINYISERSRGRTTSEYQKHIADYIQGVATVY